MNITDSQADYVLKVAKQLSDVGLRVKTDLRNEKWASKFVNILYAVCLICSFVAIKKSQKAKWLARTRKGADLGTFTVEEFAEIEKSSDRELTLLNEE